MCRIGQLVSGRNVVMPALRSAPMSSFSLLLGCTGSIAGFLSETDLVRAWMIQSEAHLQSEFGGNNSKPESSVCAAALGLWLAMWPESGEATRCWIEQSAHVK